MWIVILVLNENMWMGLLEGGGYVSIAWRRQRGLIEWISKAYKYIVSNELEMSQISPTIHMENI